MAHVRYYYDRDWPAAEQEFKRAIELNPNYPQAHHWYAIFLAWSGRPDEGLAEARKAEQLDPLSLPIGMSIGWILCDMNRIDEGIAALNKTLELDPTFTNGHHRLALCYGRKGQSDGVIAEAEKIALGGRKDVSLSFLGQAYAMTGRKKEAMMALNQLIEESKQHFVAPTLIAFIYAALGDKDQAFTWLDKALDEHDLMTARVNVDYQFDPLRNDSRFATLVKRVGLSR